MRYQRGAALLMAMIIVTLVATLAVSMVWQQWRAVQVEAAERARTQSAWILSGALDWARLILREDKKGSSGEVDHLGEPWAVPLAEARVSTFLAADKDNTDSGPEAFLSGSIVDAQSRYNLRNLLDDRGKVIPAELALLQRLLDSAGVASDVAARIATGLQDATAPPGSGGNRNPPLMPQTVAQLGWLGVDAEALNRMAPYVVLLPRRTPVNLNTAPREVIAAAIDGLDLGSAERLVQVRQRAPFKNLEQAKAQLPGGITPDPQRVGVASNFFEIHGRLRLDDRVLDESSLVERRGLEIVPLSRQRENSREPTG
ncbi:type II secretion system minor pseudopilin GspK [Piscinibacter sp.]|jgi:general secretion pathway protein K|uniref:type II secretion system minor pseudopilin GspK n=1 Tax=Piscinibacter sp. TaxID=1903157 RepID=UPI002F415B27